MNHSAGSAEVSVETGGSGRQAGRRLPGRRAKGSSLIEFALVMTFMLVPTTVGLAEFATYLSNYLALTDAVAAGARSLAISRGTTNPCNVVADVVIPTYQAGAIESGFTSANMNFKITLTPVTGTAPTPVSWSGTTTTTTPSSCYNNASPLGGFPAGMQQGGTATVWANYNPVLIFNAFGLTIPITAQTTEIVQ